MHFLQMRINPIYSIFVVLICVTIALSFDRFYLSQNYNLLLEVPCDPSTSSCFISTSCVEDVYCEKDINTYKVALLSKASIADCETDECVYEVCEDPTVCQTLECNVESLHIVADQGVQCFSNIQTSDTDEL